VVRYADAREQVSQIVEVDKIAGKDKLTRLLVDVGAGDPITVVTNAPNVKVGAKVVVALIGARLGDAEDGTLVERTKVGGVTSDGVLCDAAALGWGTANKGRAVVLPNDFEIGSAPPAEKPQHRA
jgi:phenylalanyl-tRNA synthetase beta chain